MVAVRNSGLPREIPPLGLSTKDISYLACVRARQVEVRVVRRERGIFHLRIYKNEAHVSSRLAAVLGDGFPSRLPYSRDLSSEFRYVPPRENSRNGILRQPRICGTDARTARM